MPRPFDEATQPDAPIASDIDKLVRKLLRLSRGRFFGDVTLKFAGGRLTEVNQREVIKPAELDDDI